MMVLGAGFNGCRADCAKDSCLRCTMDAQADATMGKSASYTYWVREATHQAAPAPVPRKLSPEELSLNIQQAHLGSAWNRAGTWEEKSLNAWAVGRLKELLLTIEPLEFADGSARVTKVASCKGDATLITVRNKKRVGYSFDIALEFQGDMLFGEFKDLEGTLTVADASFGELDDLQIEVDFTNDTGVPTVEKARLTEELKKFLPRIQEKLLLFEEDLKER